MSIVLASIYYAPGRWLSRLKRLFPDKFVKLYNLSGNRGVFMDEITNS